MDIQEIRNNMRIITEPAEKGLGIDLATFEALGRGYSGLIAEWESNRQGGPAQVLGLLPGASDELFLALHDDERPAIYTADEMTLQA